MCKRQLREELEDLDPVSCLTPRYLIPGEDERILLPPSEGTSEGPLRKSAEAPREDSEPFPRAVAAG